MAKESYSKLEESLAVLLAEEYAEAFQEVCGREPRYVPTSGDYWSGRTWTQWIAE